MVKKYHFRRAPAVIKYTTQQDTFFCGKHMYYTVLIQRYYICDTRSKSKVKPFACEYKDDADKKESNFAVLYSALTM